MFLGVAEGIVGYCLLSFVSFVLRHLVITTPRNCCVLSPVPIYISGWRETIWSKVSCLRKQHNSQEHDLKYGAVDSLLKNSLDIFFFLFYSIPCMTKVLVLSF